MPYEMLGLSDPRRCEQGHRATGATSEGRGGPGNTMVTSLVQAWGWPRVTLLGLLGLQHASHRGPQLSQQEIERERLMPLATRHSNCGGADGEDVG